MEVPAEADLVIDRATLLAVLEHVEEGILAVRTDGTITFAGPTIRTLLGWDPEGIVGRNVVEFLHPEEAGAALASLLRWENRIGQDVGEVLRIRSAEGGWRELWYDYVTGPAVAALGGFVLTFRPPESVDPERRALLQRLVEESRLVRLASAFLHVESGRFEDGLDRALAELAGLTWVTRVSAWWAEEEQVLCRAVWAAEHQAPSVPLPTSAPLEALPWPGVQGEVQARSLVEIVGGRVAGLDESVEQLLATPLIQGGSPRGFLLLEHTFPGEEFDATHFATLRAAAAIMAEAFARHRAELQLADQARTDRLTRLPNRWTFQEALDEALEVVAGGGSPGLGMALIDLDRFKVVNDSLGHAAGDRLLVEVAGRLLSAATAGDPGAVVARLGGDEFLFLRPTCPSLVGAVAATRELLRALEPPLTVEGQLVTITASAGVVHADDGRADGGELLRRADLAMYRAKRRGGDALMTDDALLRTRVAEQLRLEGDLRSAVEGEGLLVHLQGEWDLTGGRLLGAEALARWDHPGRGVVAAVDFIPLAEETGLIGALGRRVLREACQAVADWQRDGLAPDFLLRVNLAAQQLGDPGLVEDVAGILAETGLAPSSLCLELTESALLVDPEGAAATLERIRALGVGLAVDDFGTGYSSLLYLKALPLTSLKIDQGFVAGLPGDPSDWAIVSAVVQLARAFEISVTAEGVETAEQQGALLEMGCRRAQGYLLSRPESIEDFALRLAPTGIPTGTP